MNNRSIVSKEIQDEHLDMLIRLAFKMEEEEEIQNLLSEETRELSAEDITHKSLAYALFLEKLDAQQKKEKRKQRIQLWKSRVPKLIEIAACLILILGISAPIAVAHVESIRVMVMELLIEMQEDHASVRLIERDGAVIEVPAEWKGEYFPTYIPEGFVIDEISKAQPRIEWINTKNDHIYFNENTSSTVLHMDIEQTDTTYVDINGSEAMLVHKDGVIAMTWQDGNTYFNISCNLSHSEIIKIAESISLIAN